MSSDKLQLKCTVTGLRVVRKAVLTHAHPPALCHTIQDEQHGAALGSSITTA